MMAGMPVCLYMSFKFHEALGTTMAVCPSPYSPVIWQPKFLAGMWKIPCHSQSVDEMTLNEMTLNEMGWIKEREEQKILKQHDAMR